MDLANLLRFALVGAAVSFLGGQLRNSYARNRRQDDRFRTPGKYVAAVSCGQRAGTAFAIS